MTLLFVLLLLPTDTRSDQTTAQLPMIGVLEQHDSRWPRWPDEKVKTTFVNIVRPVFKLASAGWQPLQHSLNSPVNWYVGFDGRMIGELSSKPRKRSGYADEGTHLIVDKTSVPMIGKPTYEFGNWVDGSVARQRPLVLSTSNQFDDPQSWKPYRPTVDELSMCRRVFRIAAGKFHFGNDDKKPTSNYPDKSIKLDKAYRANTGDRILQLYIDYDLFKDDGPISEQTEYWIRIDDKDRATVLKAQGQLLDAGDYDGNGKSEIVFAFSGYNEDGYFLIADHFLKTVSNLWSYH